MDAKDIARFWAKVDVRGPDDCWPWLDKPKANGYGQISWPGGSRSAHSVAYEIAVDPVPEGSNGYRLPVDHLCHDPATCILGSDCPHRPCCNPAHLALSTAAENNRRSNSLTAKNIDKQGCPQGHPYSRRNTYTDPRGKRRCRTCRRDQQRARRASATATL